MPRAWSGSGHHYGVPSYQCSSRHPRSRRPNNSALAQTPTLCCPSPPVNALSPSSLHISSIISRCLLSLPRLLPPQSRTTLQCERIRPERVFVTPIHLVKSTWPCPFLIRTVSTTTAPSLPSSLSPGDPRYILSKAPPPPIPAVLDSTTITSVPIISLYF